MGNEENNEVSEMEKEKKKKERDDRMTQEYRTPEEEKMQRDKANYQAGVRRYPNKRDHYSPPYGKNEMGLRRKGRDKSVSFFHNPSCVQNEAYVEKQERPSPFRKTEAATSTDHNKDGNKGTKFKEEKKNWREIQITQKGESKKELDHWKDEQGGDKNYLTVFKSIISSRDHHVTCTTNAQGNEKLRGVCTLNRLEADEKEGGCKYEGENLDIHDKQNGKKISTRWKWENEDICTKTEEKNKKSREKTKWSFRHRILQRGKKMGIGNVEEEKVESNKQNKHTGLKDEDNFIIYKVPRYLRKKNIRCPFVYRKVFYGKYGIINYDLRGNKKGTLVVTFHGLNGTNLTFLEIQNMLIKYKFQVLNFDLYGHGLSACPKYNHRKKTYGIEFFLAQTEELLSHLKLLHKDFYLIGFSMGCIIAISFAKKYINQVKKIILISPVGILEKKPLLLKIIKLFPCLINMSSFFMLPCFISKKKLQKNESSQNGAPSGGPGGTDDYLYNRIMWQAFVKKNITHSLLGCINNLKMWSAHNIFKEVGFHHIPVLILCGEKDNICNVHVFKNTSKFFMNCHLIIFKNASHLVLVEKSKEINSCVLTFFHFPNNVDLKFFHHMFPVDKLGNPLLYNKINLF
ncbi:alpha/beta hydrolase, putative [Plasmodium ovale]|uniref:Alpha/beta hydrolase, putative n=1 Tax=Plasmodium ovale TaxID=36330 RepID=A0A1D3KXK8_PLAOA|nr:alpha/beta hydrolase, putative [Plasmodium ovale]